MLQPHEIKKEDDDDDRSSHNSLQKCTCKHEVEEEAENSKKTRQILVNFGLNRKKVFTLRGKKVGLKEHFISYILSEPAFSGLLENSYVVFQEFCTKFDTWVDVDESEKLGDGAVLNAVFFPSSIERDESNPGSIRKKEVQIVSGTSGDNESEIIQIDLEEEVSNESRKKKKCIKNTEIKEDKIKKKRKSMKNNNVLEEAEDTNESKSKKVKKKDSKIKDNTKIQEEANDSAARDENPHLSSPPHHMRHHANDSPGASDSPHPERADYFPGTGRFQQRPWPEAENRDSSRNYVSRNYNSYSRRSAEFAAEDYPRGAGSRQSAVHNGAYYRGHASRSRPHWHKRS